MPPPTTRRSLNITPLHYVFERVLLLIRVLLLPPLALHILLRLSSATPPLIIAIPAYPLFTLLVAHLHSLYLTSHHTRLARSLNARPIPTVRGKWPGNLDILLRMMRAFKTAYVLQVYDELFQEYGCRTLNLRILWRDQIITMDETVMKYVLATGFGHFSRGKYQKERMETFLGSGIFNRDDDIWKHHRTTARPFFARERVSDLSTFETFSARTLSLIDRISYPASSSGSFSPSSSATLSPQSPASLSEPVEAQDLYARFTLDAASVFLFGRDLRTLDGVLPIPAPASVNASHSDSPAPSTSTSSTTSDSEETRRPSARPVDSTELLRAESGSPLSFAENAKGSMTPDAFGSFASSFAQAQEIITQRARQGYFWPLFELFAAIGTLFRGKRSIKRVMVECGDASLPAQRGIRAWLDPIVADVVREKRERDIRRAARSLAVGISGERVDEKIEAVEEMKDKTFLEHLADTSDDPAEIRDELLSILLASRDTTACLLTFVTYFLALHPDVARKLRTEVIAQCGVDGQPTFESLRNLSYMRAVLNETLRLFPPVPLNVRESRDEPIAIPVASSAASPSPDNSRPLYMPPNTVIMYFPLLIQRDPRLWGPDADSFDPERWIDPKKLGAFTQNPIMFTPFSAGPRICLGQTYALTEASYFLVRLLQKYDTFTLAPEAQPSSSLPPPEWRDAGKRGRQTVERCWPAAALTLHAKGGLWVRFGKSGGPEVDVHDT